MAITKTPDKINKTSQEIDNLSFDTTYNLRVTELAGEDLESDVVRRIQSDNEGNLKVKSDFSESNMSAFNDLVVTDNTPVIQMDFVYGINTQLGSSTVANSATIDTDSGRLRLQSGTNSAGSAIFQSKRIARYRPGQGMTARFTPLFTTGLANSTQIWGVGSGSDGYFFGYNGTSFGILHRNRTVDTWIPQSSWNGDKCNGTGASEFNWDPTKGTPVMIRYAYLGYGDSTFFVQNSNNGRWIQCHTIRFSNTSVSTQVGNPSMVFYGQCLNSGNTTNLTMYCGSIGIFINGPRNFVANPKWAIANNKANVTTETNILTLKNATTYNTITNRGLIRLSSLSLTTNGDKGISTFKFKLNATLGGAPSYTTINGTTADGGVTITSGNSVASYDTAGTTVADGILIYNIVLGDLNSSVLDMIPFDIYLAPGDTLTVSATCTVAAGVSVALNWTEDI